LDAHQLFDSVVGLENDQEDVDDARYKIGIRSRSPRIDLIKKILKNIKIK
jgi:hypothetical protein